MHTPRAVANLFKPAGNCTIFVQIPSKKTDSVKLGGFLSPASGQFTSAIVRFEEVDLQVEGIGEDARRSVSALAGAHQVLRDLGRAEGGGDLATGNHERNV